MTDTVNPIVDVTDLVVGTYNYELFLAKYSNVLIQYKLVSGDNSNRFTMMIYGTVYEDAVLASTDDWSDVTELLTEELNIDVKNETIDDFAAVDSQIPFNKLKFVIDVTVASPANNSVKIGFSV